MIRVEFGTATIILDPLDQDRLLSGELRQSYRLADLDEAVAVLRRATARTEEDRTL